MSGLTHLNEDGEARMVDLSGKQPSDRTAELIPLCHPLALDQVERGVTIERIELLEKSGGRSGHWTRD